MHSWWASHGGTREVLQVEQFFMRDLDEEHSLLLELSERMKKRPVLVTFNGKSFDWPLLETRYRMMRSVPPFFPILHLDLLHPARQIWRLRLGSVRHKDLERQVLGSGTRSLDWSRQDDIDSSLIPQMYFDYLRGGPAEPLVGIFRHNQMDLRGLAALAGKILELLDSGHGIANALKAEMHDPIDVLGLSRLLRKRGHPTRARELYENALRFGLPPARSSGSRSANWPELGKTGTRLHASDSLWNALRQSPIPCEARRILPTAEDAQKALESAIEAAEQLAIYYEHRAKRNRAAPSICPRAGQSPNCRLPNSTKKLPKYRGANFLTRLEPPPQAPGAALCGYEFREVLFKKRRKVRLDLRRE